MKNILAGLALAAAVVPASAAQRSGLTVEVLVDGTARPEYVTRDAVYVEALRGREYALRLTNGWPCRVAVALAVDGLNTIDARHTTPREAAKWVLDPYETVVIPGWQVNAGEARRFVFTGERHSYGAWLGKVENLGVIEAVVYRERPQPEPVPIVAPASPLGESQAPARRGALGAADARKQAEKAGALDDELAATGIGRRTGHEVTRVHLDLEPNPAAHVRIRYEFRPQLVALGVLPSPSPGERRAHASGFDGGFCPDPSAPQAATACLPPTRTRGRRYHGSTLRDSDEHVVRELNLSTANPTSSGGKGCV